MGTSNEAIRPIPNSYWVIRGRFAAGEYPGAVDPRAAADKVGAVLEAGIDCFFDLTEEGELVPYRSIAEEEARRLGRDIEWTRHPIVDTRVPRSPGEMAGILDAIDSALGRGEKRLRTLLGRRGPDRHRGGLLAGEARAHRGRGFGRARGAVAGR